MKSTDFKYDLSVNRLYGAGFALLIILILLSLFTDNKLFQYIAIGVSLALIVRRSIFKPFAVLWFAVGDILGLIVSKIILTIIYYLVVVPVGLLMRRNLRTKMKMSEFGKNNESVFIERDAEFSAEYFGKTF